MLSHVVWVKIYRCFRSAYCLHHQTRLHGAVSQNTVMFILVAMITWNFTKELVSLSESLGSLANYQRLSRWTVTTCKTTWRHNPENYNQQLFTDCKWRVVYQCASSSSYSLCEGLFRISLFQCTGSNLRLSLQHAVFILLFYCLQNDISTWCRMEGKDTLTTVLTVARLDCILDHRAFYQMAFTEACHFTSKTRRWIGTGTVR
jgi:hypothetical protein